MVSSYTKLDGDCNVKTGKVINAIIALIMEIPCFIFLYTPNGYWIVSVIFLCFWFAACVGDALRRYTKPRAFWSKSTASAIFKTQLYWKIGPQIRAIGYAYFVLFAALIYIFKIRSDLSYLVFPDTENSEVVLRQSRELDTKSKTIIQETDKIQYRD